MGSTDRIIQERKGSLQRLVSGRGKGTLFFLLLISDSLLVGSHWVCQDSPSQLRS